MKQFTPTQLVLIRMFFHARGVVIVPPEVLKQYEKPSEPSRQSFLSFAK